MLGSGFIITHFVAMQKPQQRKYHSSCNRSVHRGTAHGKQEVKVCKRKTPHLFLMRSFLPPCGDGTKGITENQMEWQVFAPLRGWYLPASCLQQSGLVFAPLRGWYYTPKVRDDIFVFSPPYGDGTPLKSITNLLKRFSSPCGDKLQSQQH